MKRRNDPAFLFLFNKYQYLINEIVCQKKLYTKYEIIEPKVKLRRRAPNLGHIKVNTII